jgi:hypothetical protein
VQIGALQPYAWHHFRGGSKSPSAKWLHSVHPRHTFGVAGAQSIGWDTQAHILAWVFNNPAQTEPSVCRIAEVAAGLAL